MMPPQNRHASVNDLFSLSCLKVSTNSISNSTLLASHWDFAGSNFMIDVFNHCSNIFESTSSCEQYFGPKSCDVLIMETSRSLLFKFSTTIHKPVQLPPPCTLAMCPLNRKFVHMMICTYNVIGWPPSQRTINSSIKHKGIKVGTLSS